MFTFFIFRGTRCNIPFLLFGSQNVYKPRICSWSNCQPLWLVLEVCMYYVKWSNRPFNVVLYKYSVGLPWEAACSEWVTGTWCLAGTSSARWQRCSSSPSRPKWIRFSHPSTSPPRCTGRKNCGRNCQPPSGPAPIARRPRARTPTPFLSSLSTEQCFPMCVWMGCQFRFKKEEP